MRIETAIEAHRNLDHSLDWNPVGAGCCRTCTRDRIRRWRARGSEELLKATLQDLREHLTRRLPSLHGDWVTKGGRYEASFARAIGAELDGTRYWDCLWHDIYLELKLGKSVAWLDLVRYSECLLKRSPESGVPVVTLFMRYKGDRITDVYAVSTASLLQALGLTTPKAETLLLLRDGLPRPLQAQAMLTVKAFRDIALFHVGGDERQR